MEHVQLMSALQAKSTHVYKQTKKNPNSKPTLTSLIHTNFFVTKRSWYVVCVNVCELNSAARHIYVNIQTNFLEG
jgi:phage gp16-like protein